MVQRVNGAVWVHYAAAEDAQSCVLCMIWARSTMAYRQRLKKNL